MFLEIERIKPRLSSIEPSQGKRGEKTPILENLEVNLNVSM